MQDYCGVSVRGHFQLQCMFKATITAEEDDDDKEEEGEKEIKKGKKKKRKNNNKAISVNEISNHFILSQINWPAGVLHNLGPFVCEV